MYSPDIGYEETVDDDWQIEGDRPLEFYWIGTTTFRYEAPDPVVDEIYQYERSTGEVPEDLPSAITPSAEPE